MGSVFVVLLAFVGGAVLLWAIWPKSPAVPTERRHCTRCRDETDHHHERGCEQCWWQGEQW